MIDKIIDCYSNNKDVFTIIGTYEVEEKGDHVVVVRDTRDYYMEDAILEIFKHGKYLGIHSRDDYFYVLKIIEYRTVVDEDMSYLIGTIISMTKKED